LVIGKEIGASPMSETEASPNAFITNIKAHTYTVQAFTSLIGDKTSIWRFSVFINKE
jgi:hypothetical protein